MSCRHPKLTELVRLWKSRKFAVNRRRACTPTRQMINAALSLEATREEARSQTDRLRGVNGSSADNLSYPLNLDHDLISFITDPPYRSACLLFLLLPISLAVLACPLLRQFGPITWLVGSFTITCVFVVNRFMRDINSVKDPTSVFVCGT